MTLYEMLTRVPETNGKVPAILAPGRPPLSYERLIQQIDEALSALYHAGIRRNDRVAIVIPNGPEMATAFISVSCGATSAPLNPAYTASEFKFFLSNLDAKALLIQRDMQSEARTVAQALHVPVFELEPASSGEPAGLFDLHVPAVSASSALDRAEPEDAALVLHTSGTTARPKIVPLTQTNLCQAAGHIGSTLALTPADRCLNVMPLFHIHGLMASTLTSLCAGASLVCTPGFDAGKFFHWLDTFAPTWYTAVPTMHQAILSRAPAYRATIARRQLRFIRSSSAPLPEPVLHGLEATFHTPVIEAYGMTEATHQMASNPLPPQLRKAGSVGIAAGPEVAVMSEVEPVLLATSEVGEIVIRGSTVMQGYDRNPQANAQAFANGWFRTGDQGYLDADGYLFLTGRLKEIINRGGEKVSPWEVDEVLLQHPQVQQAVTFAVPDVRLGETIATAVVLTADAAVTPMELRQFAALQLADFKVPNQVLVLDAIPKGPTGKLQRIGLAETLGLLQAATSAPAAWVRPETETQCRLADLWRDVLQVDQVGLDDTFLSLGGDSVLAARLVLRVRQTMAAEFSLIDCFDASTVAEQAAIIDEKLMLAQTRQEGSGPVTEIDDQIASRPDVHRAVASRVQEDMWLADQLEVGNPVYNRPSHLRLRGLLDIVALKQSLAELIQRHESLRTAFDMISGQLMQRIEPPFVVDVPLHNLSHLPSHEQPQALRQLADQMIQTPFDLTQTPLLRASLVSLSDTEHALLLVLHHIIFDGWSESVLIDDLTALYGAVCNARPVPLTPLLHQYADYAHWQRQHLTQVAIERQLGYWKTQLTHAPSAIALPLDRPRPIEPDADSRYVEHWLPPELSNQLKAFSLQAHVTLYTTLLAGFYALLYHVTGETDMVVGAPLTGRNRLEIESLVGLFINTLALRTRVDGTLSFTKLLARVQQTVRDALLNQDVTFGQVVQALSLTRQTQRHPVFQILFQLRNLPSPREQIAELSIQPLWLKDSVSRSILDLRLDVTETQEGLYITSQFRTALFNEATVRQLLCDYEAVLTQAVASPDQALETLYPYIRIAPAAGRHFNCYVMGEGLMVIPCAEYLLRHGHRIEGIITEDDKIKAWAQAFALPCMRYRDEAGLIDFLSQRPFDYFFSVLNPYVLSTDVISLPRRLAINCHLAPLPRYGGRNVCTWAILNGEKKFGVTWHVMQKRVDAGDILKQQLFALDADETAHSLMLKCHDTAVAIFGELVDELARGRNAPIQQDTSQRTFFMNAKRPPAAAVIDWEQSAEAIDAFIRSLDYRSLPNPLGIPKLVWRGRPYGVHHSHVIDTPATVPPGTLTELTCEHLCVATQTRHVAITSLSTLTGQGVTIAEWRQQTGAQVGDQLDAISLDMNHLTALHTAIGKHESAWVQQLSRSIPLVLPVIRTGRPRTTSAGSFDHVSIPPPVVSITEHYAPAHDILAIWLAYLGRMTMQEVFDVAFQPALSHQSLPIIGLLAETVPLRVTTPRDLNTVEFVAQVEQQLATIAYRQTYMQDIWMRYPELVGQSASEVSVSVVLADGNAPPKPVAQAALTVYIDPLGGMQWVYDTTRITSADIEAMQQQFAALQQACIADRLTPLGALLFLSSEDQHLLMKIGTGPVTRWSKSPSIVALFEAQAARAPERPAVVSGAQTLTYGALNQRANQLAHHLLSHGIGPDMVVALCIPRCPHLLIGLLGILKAGATYLPIDLDYPDTRLEAIISDAEPVALVTHSHLDGRHPTWITDRIVIDIGDTLALQPITNPSCPILPSTLAYLIYTSGSTGTPKGVMIEHASLLHYTLEAAERYGLVETDRLLQFASIGFDTAAEEIFTTLTRGATLVLRSDAMLATSLDFWLTCRDWGVTVLDLPTAYWHRLVADEVALRQIPDCVRLVIIGGEKALPQHVDTWHRHVVSKVVQLMNSYGPTEATIVATSDTLTPSDDLESGHAASVGYPIANVQAYVLDAYGNQVPVGAVGELYLAGVGLGRGYWQRPAETAAVFLCNPFDATPGARMYRTGDLVRYRRDGRLEVIGRCDRQIKKLGYRIELGDIEVALLQCQAVQEAVVMVHQDTPDAVQLLAYVVGSESLTVPALYLELRARLPVFMLPDAVTILRAFPLTPNGKLDGYALPAPTAMPAVDNGRLPHTTFEKLLADIWCEVLECEPIGVQQDFFMIGGHSLLAMRVIGIIKDQLGIDITLRQFFYPPIGGGTPTIENLAQLCLERIIDELPPEAIDALLPENTS